MILCGLDLVGIGLTIGGVASDNNLMTAIGLTTVVVPAFLLGGVGGGIYGILSTQFNPKGNFIGI